MLMDLLALANRQNRRLFKLDIPSRQNKNDLLLEHFTGIETLSQPFRFGLNLLSDCADIKFKSMIGQSATLEIELADGGCRYINGHISTFSTAGSDGGFIRYSAVLDSWLEMLKQRFDSRIFQEKTIQEVVSEVFAGFGTLARYEFRLGKPLKVHSYITQYRENDLNFVQRLLEGEGLFYYFEHSADAHLMVITDDSSRLVPLPEQPSIRYHSASVTETADSITHWGATRELQPGKISLRTFDYRQPGNFLPVTLNSLNDQGDVGRFEVYDVPGHYTHGTYEQGEALVRNRIEAMEAKGKIFHGASNCRAMRPGYTFELTQHYAHDTGSEEDRQFLLLGVQHAGSNNYLTGGEAFYHNRYKCIRRKIAYRPEPEARAPVISGPQTAIVVGPPGEEIYTDELGRVKLQFHWDRQGEFDDKSSCWVRVAQSAASGGFGSIHLPRVGDEVVVHFLDGQPDRPLVIASVYNSRNTPPWSLPANKTQSGLLTRSIKGNGSTANFLRFEDKAGAEQIMVHAERNMDTEIERDETHEVGNDRSIIVGGSHTEAIRKDTLVNVQEGSYTLQVDNQFIQISARKHIVLAVGGSTLTMTPNSIDLSAELINVTSTSTMQINGAPVRVND